MLLKSLKILNSRRHHRVIILGAFAVLVTLTFGAYFNHAEALFVSPKRIVLSKTARNAEVVALNRSTQPVVVKLEWQRRAPDAAGQLTLVGDNESYPNYRPADPYLRFSPRQVILKPGQSQTFRLLVRRTDDITEGEYMSHLLIREEPLVLDDQGKAKPASSEGLAGEVQLILHRSMPVFLHHGETNIDMKITKANLRKTANGVRLYLSLNNNSTRSTYPTPILTCEKANGQIISQSMLGLRMYAQIKSIEKSVMVPKNMAAQLQDCASLEVSLKDSFDPEYKTRPMSTIAVSAP